MCMYPVDAVTKLSGNRHRNVLKGRAVIVASSNPSYVRLIVSHVVSKTSCGYRVGTLAAISHKSHTAKMLVLIKCLTQRKIRSWLHANS